MAATPRTDTDSRRVYCGHDAPDKILPLGDGYRLFVCQGCFERLLGSMLDDILERAAKWYVTLNKAK